MAKRVGHPEPRSVGRGILPGTVNKQASLAREAPAGLGHMPSNQEQESL
jgi:hypothetical protein